MELLFNIDRRQGDTIYNQIRSGIISGITKGNLPAGRRLPSTRRLAKSLKVSRNTVANVYENLAADGFLRARDRSGYFVNANLKSDWAEVPKVPKSATPSLSPWASELKITPAAQPYVDRPINWQDYPYPFIYGQIDPDLLSLGEWSECSRLALSKSTVGVWTRDAITEDDPELAEQICTMLLPRRGIYVNQDQVMVTVGAQNALYLTGALTVGGGTVVGFEDPGYCDARNGFLTLGAVIRPLTVDEQGLRTDGQLDGCRMVYTTPSHHYPTNVTLPMERREELLRRARERGFLIIEDDYESEVNFVAQPLPSLKSMDTDQRVLYVSSLSKNIFPGLRIGFMVGPADLIAQARALRRQMYRHPSSQVQRAVSLFLKLGYYDSMVKRLHQVYRERWELTGRSLEKHLGGLFTVRTFGGTSFWVTGPDGLDAGRLALRAREEGILIEPGAPMFFTDDAPRNHFRVGFSAIPTERIETGIEILARVLREETGRRAEAPGSVIPASLAL